MAPARVMLGSAILATYTMLSAREVWHARDRELISRWPTLALLVLHAGFLLARIPFATRVDVPRNRRSVVKAGRVDHGL